MLDHHGERKGEKMKLISLFLTVAISALAAAAPLYVMDTRANRGAAASYCEAMGTECKVVETKAREFSNGNTFVQVQENLGNKHVRVILPEELNSDLLMEVLLEIHTAHTWGARQIDVVASAKAHVAEDGETLFTGRELDGLLALAGAHDVIRPDGTAKLIHPTTSAPFSPAVLDSEFKVLSLNHDSLGTELAEGLGIGHDIVELGKTPVETFPAGSQVLLLSTISAPTNKNFFEALKIARLLKNRANRVVQVFPYFPYVRSDKIDQPGVSVGGRLVADLIENSGVDMVAFVKLHAPQAQGFFGIPTIHIETRSSINEQLALLGVDGIVSPDAGFQKEATLYANQLGLPVYVINKQRDPKTGESMLQKMGDFDVRGKKLAIIDDETASGSTLAAAAEFLKSQGADTVYGFVTHLAGDAGKAIESKDLDRLYTTDTFPQVVTIAGDRVAMIPVAKDLILNLRPFVENECARVMSSRKDPK